MKVRKLEKQNEQLIKALQEIAFITTSKSIKIEPGLSRDAVNISAFAYEKLDSMGLLKQ